MTDMADDEFDRWMRDTNAELYQTLSEVYATEASLARVKRFLKEHPWHGCGLEDGSHDQDPPHEPGE